jgi:hypothetical protein
MALTTVQVHGQILDPDGLTPAVGTVTFRTLIELRDVVDNIVYPPADFTATLDVLGEFTIVLPTTDNPDILPINWVYQVYINTTGWTSTQYVQLPFAPGTTEFADLTPLDYDPCTGSLTATPLAPGEAGLYVLKTGDTMSGNLVINANLQVAGSAAASYQGISGDLVQLLSTMLSTNVTSGGEITPNVDPTKIDIAPLEGWIVDYNSTTTPIGPTNPALTYISYPGATAVTPLFVPLSFYLIDSAGVLFQQATRPTSAQRRQNLLVGLTVTEAGVVVVDQTIPVVPSQVNNQLVDLMNNLGPFIISGNIISPNGVNLTFNKTAGPIFARAFSQVPNYLAPNEATLPAQTPTNFRRITAAPGFASGVVNTIDVANYDPNATGIVTPIPGGANTSTNFRVWAVANNIVADQVFVQYGQRSYASLAAARAAISSGQYIPNPITVGAALVGWITATKSAVNLSDPTQAIFTQAGKFSTP